MRRCLATVSLSGNLETKLHAIAKAGFDSIEIFENDLIAFPGTPKEVARIAADLGLTIDLYQPFRDFESVPPDLLVRNLDRADRKFDLMAELGATNILLCSNVQPYAINDESLAAAQLNELALRAAPRGIRLSYEALSWGRHVKHYRQAYDIVLKADHPNLGICLDSFHVLSLGDDPSGIAYLRGEKIFFLQIADAPILSMDVLQWSRHFRCFPGQGGFDLAGFVGHVLEAGYDGPMSLEVFNDIFRAAPDLQIAGNAMQGLLLLEEQITNQSSGAHGELFRPPPPPTIRAFSFLEFAAEPGPPGSSALERVLIQMGFQVTGQHRSKSVTLYGQGSIRIVVNREPGSDAAAHLAEQGSSVCALGLSSDDAELARLRAAAFRVPEFSSPIGPQEAHFPAIRATDGNLIYFLSASEEGLSQDFLQTVPTVTEDAGLLSVDHFALALPGELFDASVLFFRIVLGLVPEESFDLADPFGLIRSRALHSSNGILRIVLNVSESAKTRVGRSVEESNGPTVQHVAFACRDIFNASRKLKAAGLAVLRIPANYYRDLESRTQMVPKFCRRLEEENILYEQTAEGQFFHFYLEAFEGRFSFEFVQRVGDYRGYGASNAQVRIAAQSRLSSTSIRNPTKQ